MADDDIDIEEHDVLNNPVIRKIFPDLSVLKKEIIDFNDELPIKQIYFQSGVTEQQDEKHWTTKEDSILTLPSFLLDPTSKKIEMKFALNSNDMILRSVKEEYKSNKNKLCNKLEIEEHLRNEETDSNNIIIEKRCIKNKFVSNMFFEGTSDKSKEILPLKIQKTIKKSNVIPKAKIINSENQIETPSQSSSLKKENLRTASYAISKPYCIEKSSLETAIESEQKKFNEQAKSFLPWSGNNIILGSKPYVKQLIDGPYVKGCKKLNFTHNLNVSLENLETFLSKSRRYCKNCLILFPSIKTLNDHKSRIHTELSDVKLSELTRQMGLSVNTNEKHKCDLCDKVFSSVSYLLRHKRITHKINTNVRKKERVNPKNHIQAISHDKLNKDNRKFKCSHCNYSFLSQQLLINHMYKVLRLKNKKVTKPAEKIKYAFDKKGYTEVPNLYRCPVCSYYFKLKILFHHHVRVKHNITANMKLEKVSFEPTCKYCSHKYTSTISFNAHVRKFHQKEFKMHKTITKSKDINFVTEHKCQEEVIVLNKNNLNCNSNNGKKDVKKNKYLLKSALFKCIKCDVCFLSGNRAAAHVEHMDMLVDWKCLKCLNTFKKEDEILHTQQHMLTSAFDLFEISESAKSFLLYRCPNCTTYFLENDLFNHYSICENQTPNAAYCKICHILIDNAIKESHDIQHKQIGGKELNNILVDSDVVISDEENKNCYKEGFEKIIDFEKEISGCIEKSTNLAKDTNVDMKKSINVEFPQTNFSKPQNFLQIDKIGEIAVKKLLSFVYCNTCKCFVSRVHKLYNHTKTDCSNLIRFVCKYCGLTFSNKSINGHRKLHQDLPGLTLNDFKFYDLKSGKTIWPPAPLYPNCYKCEKHFITKTAIISHQCGEDYKTCLICKTKFSTSAFTLHMAFHNYLPKKISRTGNDLAFLDLQSKSVLTTFMNSIDSNKNYEHNCLLAYICKKCKVALDVYDKVIEHCQKHLSGDEKELSTKPCSTCNLIFDVTCFDNHQILHASNTNKNFTVLSFDVFYATAENTIWLNHLFGSLPATEIDKIIGNSMYKYERRIKMKILQDGLISLTLYKCAKCNSHIDSRFLFDHCHMDVLCYESMAVPCSFCGIYLASENFRIEHEKIHIRQNVSLKSYRIVLFNCAEDKTINNALSLPNKYVLYQCRNCEAVVDKTHFQNHKCDFDDITKCSHCGLLLYNNEYMPHILKHKEFDSFHENNMRVILIGLLKDGAEIKGRTISLFNGMKSDYLLYQCVNCQGCVNDKQCCITHKCLANSELTKCPKCDLCFEDTRFKSHRKSHENDPYFSIENLTVVKFNFKISSPSDLEVIVIEDDEVVSNKINNVLKSNGFNNNYNLTPLHKIIKDKIFKCVCGLHFLNESSAVSHSDKCNSRSAKQICSKCGLAFKPSILYKHLLIHHGSKNISYKFNIIQVSSNS